MALAIWVVDPGLVRRGMLVDATAAAVVLRDADLGTFTVTVPMGELSSRVISGWRLLIQDGEETVLSGPVLVRSGSVSDQSFTFSGVSDLCHLDRRLVYPDPSQPATAQTAEAAFKFTGEASWAIDQIVHRNAGSGAIAARQTPGLVMAVAQGGRLGSSVKVSERFTNVLEASRKYARLGGVTFDAVQSGAAIRVGFRVPVDRSRTVRFNAENGGLVDGTYSVTAATVTAAVIGGQGEGTFRNIREVSRPGARIERFVDQSSTDDDTEIAQAAKEALDDGAESASAQVDVTERPGLVYGTDYRLGDRVTVELGAATISEPVRQVEITWDGFGRTVSLGLGDHADDADRDTAWVKAVKDIYKRLRAKETI